VDDGIAPLGALVAPVGRAPELAATDAGLDGAGRSGGMPAGRSAVASEPGGRAGPDPGAVDDGLAAPPVVLAGALAPPGPGGVDGVRSPPELPTPAGGVAPCGEDDGAPEGGADGDDPDRGADGDEDGDEDGSVGEDGPGEAAAGVVAGRSAAGRGAAPASDGDAPAGPLDGGRSAPGAAGLASSEPKRAGCEEVLGRSGPDGPAAAWPLGVDGAAAASGWSSGRWSLARSTSPRNMAEEGPGSPVLREGGSAVTYEV
jgi:hypothetical protein